MNLNKTLCKYLDTEMKGYVNIGDILSRFFRVGLIAAIIIGLLYSFYQGIMLIITNSIFGVTDNINDVVGCFGIAMMILILAVLIVAGLASACEIKIATCEYKKDDE